MEIQNEFDPITEQDLLSFEKGIDLKLPEDYKEFIIRNNGGYPTLTKFLFTDTRGNPSESLVDYFFPVGTDFMYNVGALYDFMKSEDRLPNGMLPIAYDPFGNMVCISLSGEAHGSVYFWDHELEFEENNLSIIANSFSDFIFMLH